MLYGNSGNEYEDVKDAKGSGVQIPSLCPEQDLNLHNLAATSP